MKLIFYGTILFEVLLNKTKVVYFIGSTKAVAIVPMWCHTIDGLTCDTKCIFHHQLLDIYLLYFFLILKEITSFSRLFSTTL